MSGQLKHTETAANAARDAAAHADKSLRLLSAPVADIEYLRITPHSHPSQFYYLEVVWRVYNAGSSQVHFDNPVYLQVW